jgi:hypothetical protein
VTKKCKSCKKKFDVEISRDDLAIDDDLTIWLDIEIRCDQCKTKNHVSGSGKLKINN